MSASEIASREAAAKAYAEATGYPFNFHPGLSSESADQIRTGTEAAIKAALKNSVANNEFTDLIVTVAQSENSLKSAAAVIGAMASVVEMTRGKAAVRQLFDALAKATT